MASESDDQGKTVRTCVERLSPDEQKAFAKTLLKAEAGIHKDGSVPESVVRASRLFVLVLAAVVALAGRFGEDSLRVLLGSVLLIAVAWFPNEVASMTGWFGAGRAVTRASHPWVLLIIAWLLLLACALAIVFDRSSHDGLPQASLGAAVQVAGRIAEGTPSCCPA